MTDFVYTPPPGDPPILHVDDDILAVDKPAGLLSVPGRGPERADCLIARLRAQFPQVLLVHRLDLDTSGVIVFALTPQAQAHLGRQFEHRRVQKRYVARVAGTRRFRLTLRCLDLGFNAIARADLRMQARPILRDLVGAVNEAASIGVLDGADVVYIERIQAGIARLGVDVRIGSRVPVYSSAIGRAILAYLPRETQIAVLDARPRERLTEATVTDRAALLAILDRVREDGIAFSDQETVPGLRVLACALIDADGVPLGGISVAAPALRMTADEYLRQAGPPLIAAARALSRGLEAAGGTAAPARPQLADPTPTRRHRP